MTRKQAKQWAAEITAWGEGKNLWYFSCNKWFKFNNQDLDFKNASLYAYVIEDEHFEARKAFALGKPVQIYNIASNCWELVLNPVWTKGWEYRLKPLEWHDTVSKENQVLCRVWNDNKKDDIVKVVGYSKDDVFPYKTLKDYEGSWRYAEPIKPEECWQGVINER